MTVKLLLTCLLSVTFSQFAMKQEQVNLSTQTTTLQADNIDSLVYKGIAHIKKYGSYITARAGTAQQAYDVNYVLTNSRNRVHYLRKPLSVRYFCKELQAYFDGSLKVKDGLGKAAKMWNSLADQEGNICSNYGYYIFHQRVPEFENKTQYQWAITQLINNLQTRKAFININQPKHKFPNNKDFPCTLGMQFFIKNNHFCCTVSSRSTDIYTGLPYDMGFFALVTELMYKDLKEQLPKELSKNLKLGYTMMKTNFTQIYDRTRTRALKLLDKEQTTEYATDMPEITDARAVLQDIYKKTNHTLLMKWIQQNAQRKKKGNSLNH